MLDCRADLLICIDWIAVSIGNFLKDGITLSCLGVLLILLLRVRARQAKREDDAYAAGLMNNSGRLFEPPQRTWVVKDQPPD